MPPKRDAPTQFLFKYSDTTIFLPISASSTLPSLRKELFKALPKDDPILSSVQNADEIALWREASGKGGEKEKFDWERIDDEKTTVDKWGLKEAAHIGVSFKKDGKFPEPKIDVISDVPEMDE